jgi:putative ABC transport system permease protein
MIENYLKTALRNIRRNKIFSLINIFGLSIGLSAFILIVLYVKHEFSYDKYHSDFNDIYRVATEFHGHDHAGLNKMAITRSPLGPALREAFPEVQSAARIKRNTNIKIHANKQDFFEKEIFFTDPEVFEIFTLPLITGYTNLEDTDPFTVILSEKVAKKYFDEINPIGQTIRYMEEFDFKVIAIMKDMPKNSHFVMEVIFPLSALVIIKNENLNDWRRSSAYTYLKLEQETNISEVNKKMTELSLKHVPPRIHGDHTHRSSLFLQPLSSIHLHSNIAGEISANNDIKNIYLFVSIALMILIIACFNYMNLTTANSLKRYKEVGIRKTVGAEKLELIKQFLSESLIVTHFALLFSLLIIELILPVFNSFFDRDLKLLVFENIDFFVWIFVITAIVGLFSGSYPAFVLSSLKPLKIFNLEGNLKHRKIQLRNVFVVLQFSISIVLVICTFIISEQLNYILSKDVGFQRDQIVTIPVRGKEISENLGTIKTELRKFAGIQMVSSSTYLPNDIRDQTRFNWLGKDDENEIRCYVSFADYDYVDLYGIEIASGRNFSRDYPSDENGAFLINETAVKALEWKEPLNHELIHWSGKTGKVVGVVKDFNFHSLHRNIEPLYLYFNPNERNYYLSVKLAGGTIKENLKNIENTLAAFSSKYPFEFNFFDEIFNKAYREEIRMEQIFEICAIIAFFISCMGLLGLALFTVEKRTKEIGIRKVLGATESGIVFMLSKEFTKWVLIANIFAWPIAWYAMNHWLQNFAYKTEMNLGIYLFSGGLVLVVAFLTISLQTIKAAFANPIESLRYE